MSEKKIEYGSKNKPGPASVKKPKRPQVLPRKDAQVKEANVSASAQKVSTLSVVQQSSTRVEWVVKDSTIISPSRISLKKKHSKNSDSKPSSKTAVKKSVVRGRSLESAEEGAKNRTSPSAKSLKQESFVLSDEMKDSEWVQRNESEKLVSMEKEKLRSASGKPRKEKAHAAEAKSVIRKARTTTVKRKKPKRKPGKSRERLIRTETPVEKKSTEKPERKSRKGPEGQEAKVLKQSKRETIHKSSTSSDKRVKRKKLKTEQQHVTEIKMITVQGSKGKRLSQASSKNNTTSLADSPTANNVDLEESTPSGGNVGKSTNGKPTQSGKSNMKLKERGKKSQSTVGRRVRIRRLKRRRVESLKAGRAAKKQRLNNSPIKDVVKQKISKKKRRAKSQLPVQQRKRLKDLTSKTMSKSAPKTPKMSRKKSLYKSTILEAQKENINIVSESKSTDKVKGVALKHMPVSKTTKRALEAKLNLRLKSKSSLKPQSPHGKQSSVSYAAKSQSPAVVKQTPVKRTPKRRKKVPRQVYKKITKFDFSSQKLQRKVASALKKTNVKKEMKIKEKDESMESSVESSEPSSASTSESSESSEASSESPMSSELESSEMESSDHESVESESSAGGNSKKKKLEKSVQKEKVQGEVAQAVGKASSKSKVSAKPRTKEKMKQQRKKGKRTKKRNPKDAKQLVPVSGNVSTEPNAQLHSNQGKDLMVMKVKKVASGPDEVAYKLLGVTTATKVKKLVGKKELKTTAEANEKVLPQVRVSKKKKTKGRGAGKGLLKRNAKTSEKLPQKSRGKVEKVKASKKRKTKGHSSGKGLMKPSARTSKELLQKSERELSKKISEKKVSNEDIKENDSQSDPSEPICQNIKIVKTKTGLYMTENVESNSTSSSESDDENEESSTNDSDVSISMESRGKKTMKVTDDNFSKAPSSTTESDSISTSTPDTSATSSSSSTSESTTASTSSSSSVSDSEVVLKKFKTVVGKKNTDELNDTSKPVSSLVRKSGASSTVSSTESEDSDDSSSESSSDEDIPILQLKKTIIRARKRKARKPISRGTKRQRRRIVRVKSGKDCQVEKITGEKGGKDGQVKALEIAGDADKKPVTQEIEGEVMSSGASVKTLSSKEASDKTFGEEKKTISAKRKKKKNRRRRVRRRRRRVSQPKEKISITPYQRKNLDFVYSYALKNGYTESNWKDVAKSIRRIKKVKIEEAIEKKLGKRLSSGLNLVRMKFFNLPRVCLKKSDKRRIEREINKKLKTIRKTESRNYSQQLVSQKVDSYSPSYEKSGSLPLTPTLGQNSETNFMLDLSDDKSLSVNSSINMADLNEEAQNQVLDKFLTLFGA